MTRKSIALLLTLFIGLSPVMSAFADCLESNHAKNGRIPSFAGTVHAPEMVQVTDDRNDVDGHGDYENVGCHTGSVCAFHLCGGLGLTGSIRFTASVLANQHPLSIRVNLNSRVLAPELEPPIRIL